MFIVLARSQPKRSNIKKLLNEWHWQMLSILKGLHSLWWAEQWEGVRTGTGSWVGPMLSRARTAETTRAEAGSTRPLLGLGFLMSKACWGKEMKSVCTLRAVPYAITQNLQRIDKMQRAKKKNWLAGTQLRDSCAQNRKDMMADSLLHLEKTMHNCYHKRAVSASILPVMFKNGCPTGIQQLAYLQQQACRD